MTAEAIKSTTPTAEHSNLLEVRDLQIEFDTPAGVLRAVNGVSFSVRRGEVLGLVGESGCGKSVTARSILGLLGSNSRIMGGQILFEGRDLLTLERASLRKVRGKEIGFISQDPMVSLNPLMRIGRQVCEGMEMHLGLSKSESKKRAIEILDMTGIRDPLGAFNSYPNEMSGGMLQRVAIAIAVSCTPKLIIADEPTTALDTTIQDKVLTTMLSLTQELGTALILITHDLGVVAGMADLAKVMYAGQVVESGTMTQLFSNSSHPYTRGLIGSSPNFDGPQDRLVSIPGAPPDMRQVPTGCRFSPRCALVVDRCHSDNPPLELVSLIPPTDQRARCWVANPLLAEKGKVDERRV